MADYDQMLGSCSMETTQEDHAGFSGDTVDSLGVYTNPENAGSSQFPATEFRITLCSPPGTPDSPDEQPSPDPLEVAINLQNIMNPRYHSDGNGDNLGAPSLNLAGKVQPGLSPRDTGKCKSSAENDSSEVLGFGRGVSCSGSVKKMSNSPTGGKTMLKLTAQVSGSGLRLAEQGTTKFDEPGDTPKDQDPPLKHFNEIFGKYKIRSEPPEGSGPDTSVTGKSRKLPPSVEGDLLKKAERLLPENLMDVIDMCSAEPDTSLGGIDVVEMAKRSGLTFPRPRWWSKDHP